MSHREAHTAFLTEVIPAYRDRGAWEELAWNLIAKLNEDQLRELIDEHNGGSLVTLPETAQDGW